MLITTLNRILEYNQGRAKMNRVITLDQLIAARACEDQRKLFTSKWPGGSVRVTQKLCVAAASEFQWDWAAKNLLSADKYATYESIRNAAWADYVRICDAVWADFERIRDATYADFERARARAFAKLYNQ